MYIICVTYIYIYYIHVHRFFVFFASTPQEICGHGDAKSSGCLDRNNRDKGMDRVEPNAMV